MSVRTGAARRPGPLALAVATLGAGVLTLVLGNLSVVWQSAPASFPHAWLAAEVTGAILVGGAIGLFIPAASRASAWALALVELGWTLGHLWDAARAPGEVVSWESLCEALAWLVALYLLAIAVSRSHAPGSHLLTADLAVRLAQRLFGVCCVVFGVAHVAYAEFTSQMIPSWIPGHLALTYFTGACHALAGLAILSRTWDRLAARLEAAMIGVFILLLHIPSLWMEPAPAWGPTPPERWTELLIAITVAASAAMVADSLAYARANQ